MPRTETSEETSPAHILILDFKPQEPWDKFLLFKPPSPWKFLMAALADDYKLQGGGASISMVLGDNRP